MTVTRAASVGPGDYTDPATTGLQLRVRAKRGGFSRTRLFRFKWRGQPVRIVLGHLPALSYADARRRLEEYRQALDAGIDPRRAKPRRRQLASPASLSADLAGAERHTIEHLIADYMERHAKPQHKRPEYVEKILNRDVLPEWKGRDARTITPTEVIALLDKVLDRGSRVMANRLASLLSQLFRWGIHRRIVEDSPVKLLYKPGGKEKPRERTLTDDELKALLSVDPLPRWERLHRTINLLLLTGQRRGELVLASWKEFDLKGKLWTVPSNRTKTGKTTLVPLSDWAVEELEALKREGEGSQWVFPSDTDKKAPADPKLLTRNLARAQVRFKKELGIEPFTLHDLRRTCRTGLARLKVQPHVAERVLNHAQEKIAGTYDLHDYLDEKREALDRWAGYLRGLLHASG